MAQVHVSVDPFHVGSLFTLRTLLRSLDPSGVPTLATIATVPPCRNLALLPGSFNPPTAAHLLFAERALGEGFDRVVFTYAVRTLGKERSGLIPEDRLLAVRAMIENSFGVGACSHGLYADQADAAGRVMPGAEVALLVGSDKVLQIFEDRWYADRDAALERLFASAALVVAPRSDQEDALRHVLDEPRNRRFRDRVEVLRLHPAVADLSSTRVRGMLRAGAEPAGLVPAGVAEMLGETGAFASPVSVGAEEIDAYGLRADLIDLLWTARTDDGAAIDLRALWRIGMSPTEAGRRLRARLAEGSADAAALAAAAGV